MPNYVFLNLTSIIIFLEPTHPSEKQEKLAHTYAHTATHFFTPPMFLLQFLLVSFSCVFSWFIAVTFCTATKILTIL